MKIIQEKRVHIERMDGAKKFILSVFKGKTPINKETKSQWIKYKKDMLDNMFVYEQDIQNDFRIQIDRMDGLMQSVK